MANPQREDGYTAIANSIMDALCKIRIPGEARQVFDVVFRKTYGWNKREDAISLSQFCESTGLNKPHVVVALDKLKSMNLITEKGNAITEKGNSICKVYEINKDFELWKPLPKKVMQYPKKVKVVTEKGNASLPFSGTTKDTATKDTITKTRARSRIIPDWIPQNTFLEYLEMRNKIKKPLLEKSFPRFFASLKKVCEESRASPEQILNQSIINSWQGIFPLKTGANTNAGIRTSRSDPRDRTLQSREDAEIAAITAKWEAAKAASSNHAGGDAGNDDAPDFSG